MTKLRLLVPALAVGCLGCNWISLGVNAATYATLAPGEAGNIVARGAVAYVTLGDSGLGVVDAGSGARLAVIPPPAGSESVDDLAIDGALLFTLDASPPGHLSLWNL